MRMKRIVSLFLALVFVFTLIPAAAHAATIDYSVLEGRDILRGGSSGTVVTNLQKALVELGYLSSKPDGIYGEKTEDAVKAFQRKNGFAGVIGYGGVATMFTQGAIYGKKPIPAWSKESVDNNVSGEFEVSNFSMKYSAYLDGTVSFTNKETQHVTGICLYCWLVDDDNYVVPCNGYDYWMYWYPNVDFAKDSTWELSFSLNPSSKEMSRASSVRFIIGELAYDDGSVYINFDASEQPYYSTNYVLDRW